MAELVGFVASTVTVAGVASTATSKLKRLWDEVQNVPETITDLVQQMEILESHIGQIEREINERGAFTNPIFNDSAVRLSTEYCRKCMESLANIVDDLRTKIDTQKNPKRAFSKMRVVLKKQVLAHFEGRLQKAVALLGLTQQGYILALIKLQPHIMMGDFVAHNSRCRGQLNAAKENADMLSRNAIPMRRVDINFTSSRREGWTDSTSCSQSTRPSGTTRRAQRSWSNSLMNGTIGIHYLNRHLPPHCISESSCTIRIHLPYWLARTVWDIQVAKATSGWKAKLRVWRVAPDSLAIKAVKDDDYYGLRESLVAGHATLFDRTQTGDTLLHLAAQHANRDIIHLLVTAGLGFDERNDELISVLRRFVYHLQQTAHLSDMLSFLISQDAFENPVYECVVSANRRDIPTLAIVDFTGESKDWESSAPDILMIYQSYIIPRLQDLKPFISIFFVAAPGNWCPQDVRILVWKDGRIREDNISRVMDDGFPVWNLLVYSMGTSESLTNNGNLQKWQSYILQDAPGITGSDNLHSSIDVPGCQPWLLHNPQSPLTPLLWLLLLTLDSWHAQGHLCNSFEEVYSPYLKPALRKWDDSLS